MIGRKDKTGVETPEKDKPEYRYRITNVGDEPIIVQGSRDHPPSILLTNDSTTFIDRDDVDYRHGGIITVWPAARGTS